MSTLRAAETQHARHLHRPARSSRSCPPRSGGLGNLTTRGRGSAARNASLLLAASAFCAAGMASASRCGGHGDWLAAHVVQPRYLPARSTRSVVASTSARTASGSRAPKAACSASLSALSLPSQSRAVTVLPSLLRAFPTAPLAVCAGIQVSDATSLWSSNTWTISLQTLARGRRGAVAARSPPFSILRQPRESVAKAEPGAAWRAAISNAQASAPPMQSIQDGVKPCADATVRPAQSTPTKDQPSTEAPSSASSTKGPSV